MSYNFGSSIKNFSSSLLTNKWVSFIGLYYQDHTKYLSLDKTIFLLTERTLTYCLKKNGDMSGGGLVGWGFSNAPPIPDGSSYINKNIFFPKFTELFESV